MLEEEPVEKLRGCAVGEHAQEEGGGVTAGAEEADREAEKANVMDGQGSWWSQLGQVGKGVGRCERVSGRT